MSARERDGICLVCGASAREHMRRSSTHGAFWQPVEHPAPCGAPCIGGGTRYSAAGITSTHRTTECATAGCDGGVLAGGAS